MLDLLMFAAEPFGTWGPGPAPVANGWWAQLLEAVINDPQAVATIVAAFLGFLGGVLIKDWLDRRRDKNQRKQATQDLAAALLAELNGIQSIFAASANQVDEHTKEKGYTRSSLGPANAIDIVSVPDTHVYLANVDRLALLPRGLDRQVIGLYGLLQMLPQHITMARQAIMNDKIRWAWVLNAADIGNQVAHFIKDLRPALESCASGEFDPSTLPTSQPLPPDLPKD